jgi:hypothetical protein
MRTFIRLLIASLFVISFASCAHHRDVRPGADGIHRVVVRAQDKDQAERNAISQAEHYCEQSQKLPGFMDEKTQYTGSMDESTRDTVRKASTAALVLGGAGTVAGSNGVRTGGSVLGGAGAVGAIMTSGNDYVSEMRFKCQ